MRSWGKDHEGSRLWKEKWLLKALEDENSYGFGAGTKCLACPYRPDSPQLPGTVDRGLGALSSAKSVFIVCFILCPDFLMREKDRAYRPCYTLSNMPFSSSASLLASRQFVLLTLKPGPHPWRKRGHRLFTLLSLGSKFLNLEDLGAGC